MAQTGTIYGYHDGNTYSLANVYDEKLNEYNILAGTSAREIVSVSFNTETGVDYYFDSDVATNGAYMNFMQSSTLLAAITSASKPISKITTYLSADHAAAGYDYALNCTMSTKRYLVIGAENYPLELIPLTKDASGNYIKSIRPSFEYDGWFFINTSTYSNNTNYSAQRALCYAALQIAYNSTTYKTPDKLHFLAEENDYPQFWFDSATATISPVIQTPVNGVLLSTTYPNLTYVRVLDRSVFDRPFHLKVQWFNGVDNPNYIMLCFVDDALYCYIPRTPDDVDKTYYGYKIKGLYLSTTRTVGNPNDISVSSFKMSLLSPVYQKVNIPANMLIRHNATNHYIPLTTSTANTSAPYIAVRHGNTNFYTLK